MHIPVEHVASACEKLEGLTEPSKRQQLAVELAAKAVPKAILPPENVELFLDFLRLLPNAGEQRKIVLHLQKICAENGCAISNLVWWDISQSEHWMLAKIARDGREIVVSFCWKTVRKGRDDAHGRGKPSVIIESADVGWVFDASAPGRARFHFGQPEYHALIDAFERWFKQPLPASPFLAPRASPLRVFCFSNLCYKH